MLFNILNFFGIYCVSNVFDLAVVWISFSIFNFGSFCYPKKIREFVDWNIQFSIKYGILHSILGYLVSFWVYTIHNNFDMVKFWKIF